MGGGRDRQYGWAPTTHFGNYTPGIIMGVSMRVMVSALGYCLLRCRWWCSPASLSSSRCGERWGWCWPAWRSSGAACRRPNRSSRRWRWTTGGRCSATPAPCSTACSPCSPSSDAARVTESYRGGRSQSPPSAAGDWCALRSADADDQSRSNSWHYPLVQPVGVQTVRHGAGDGPPAAAVRLPLRPALRRVRPAHHLLMRPVWPRATAGGGRSRRPVLLATDAHCAVQTLTSSPAPTAGMMLDHDLDDRCQIRSI